MVPTKNTGSAGSSVSLANLKTFWLYPPHKPKSEQKIIVIVCEFLLCTRYLLSTSWLFATISLTVSCKRCAYSRLASIFFLCFRSFALAIISIAFVIFLVELTDLILLRKACLDCAILVYPFNKYVLFDYFIHYFSNLRT